MRLLQMVTQIFGDMLYYSESDCFQNFPSPEELKYRVILSTKPPKEYLESKITKDKGNLSPDGIDTSEEEAVTLAELLSYEKVRSAFHNFLNHNAHGTFNLFSDIGRMRFFFVYKYESSIGRFFVVFFIFFSFQLVHKLHIIL